MSRNQQIMPHISDLEDTATVVIRFASTGAANTYNIPWVKSGLPITSADNLADAAEKIVKAVREAA